MVEGQPGQPGEGKPPRRAGIVGPHCLGGAFDVGPEGDGEHALARIAVDGGESATSMTTSPAISILKVFSFASTIVPRMPPAKITFAPARSCSIIFRRSFSLRCCGRIIIT